MKKIISRPRIIIFCNGSVAEPQYFQSFKEFLKIPHRIKIIYRNTGSDSPWRLIERAIEEKGKDSENEIWCVFDVDRYLTDNASKMKFAIKRANENEILLAWSNVCFELWYLLHFIHFNQKNSSGLCPGVV